MVPNATTTPTMGQRDSSKRELQRKLRLAILVLWQIPLVMRVALLHLTGMSEQSKYLDLQSEVIVAVLRSVFSPSKPKSITATQKLASHDPGVKGNIWVANYAVPTPPEEDVQQAFAGVVESLQQTAGLPGSQVRLPEVKPVEAEWTGYRAIATKDSRLPQISEKQRYLEMQKEVTSPVTILYFHGGAYYLLDPCTHRAFTQKLARMTGGRCYSVRYRLAPQDPFPAAVLDALVSYLALIYPPPDAYHAPVQPEHVVFAGDSAGGNLCLSLTQTLLELRRQERKITWFGESREVPLPAGVGVCSPWIDMVLSSPSWVTNQKYDYLPTKNSMTSRAIPPCAAWPASPPRAQLYAEDAHLAHPLATLLMAEDWEGAPPVFMTTGWELLADEDKVVAQKLHNQGVKVVFEEYEAMPHCFALLLSRTSQAKRCFDGWVNFINETVIAPEKVESRAVTIKAKTLEEVELSFDDLNDATDEEIRARVLAAVEEVSLSAGSIAKL